MKSFLSGILIFSCVVLNINVQALDERHHSISLLLKDGDSLKVDRWKYSAGIELLGSGYWYSFYGGLHCQVGNNWELESRLGYSYFHTYMFGIGNISENGRVHNVTLRESLYYTNIKRIDPFITLGISRWDYTSLSGTHYLQKSLVDWYTYFGFGTRFLSKKKINLSPIFGIVVDNIQGKNRVYAYFLPAISIIYVFD